MVLLAWQAQGGQIQKTKGLRDVGDECSTLSCRNLEHDNQTQKFYTTLLLCALLHKLKLNVEGLMNKLVWESRPSRERPYGIGIAFVNVF